jgi:hypothetical protein
MDSAPSVGLQVSHHYGLGEALLEAANYHMMTLLDLAVKYQKWWGLWGWIGFLRESKKRPGGVRGQRAKVAPGPEEVRLYSL